MIIWQKETVLKCKIAIFRNVLGFINSVQDDDERKNYNCDITYATNSELGFDYLRDNMKYSKEEMVQREHFFNSRRDRLFLTEARTPLIISGAAEDKPTNILLSIS